MFFDRSMYVWSLHSILGRQLIQEQVGYGKRTLRSPTIDTSP